MRVHGCAGNECCGRYSQKLATVSTAAAPDGYIAARRTHPSGRGPEQEAKEAAETQESTHRARHQHHDSSTDGSSALGKHSEGGSVSPPIEPPLKRQKSDDDLQAMQDSSSHPTAGVQAAEVVPTPTPAAAAAPAAVAPAAAGQVGASALSLPERHDDPMGQQVHQSAALTFPYNNMYNTDDTSYEHLF
jgi:hypothetical protein